MLPQSNGKLITIDSDSTSDDWDAAAGAGTPKWSGNSDIYITQKIRTVFSESEGGLVKFREVNIIIDDTLRNNTGGHLDIQTGDIVTYQDYWGNEHTRRVMDDTNPILGSIPAAMTYRNLHMEPEKLEA